MPTPDTWRKHETVGSHAQPCRLVWCKRKACTRDEPKPVHTVNGQTSENGWPYGTTHDMDCPACVASGTPYTASPRSETYWSS